jgi:hypothetical protein
MQNKPGNKDTISKTETYGEKNYNKRNPGEKNLRNNKHVTKRPQNVMLLKHLHCYCPSVLYLSTVSNRNTDDVFNVDITFLYPHIKQCKFSPYHSNTFIYRSKSMSPERTEIQYLALTSRTPRFTIDQLHFHSS